jgi:hypothetical protein
VNAGLLIFAAFLADFLLGWFGLAGWEGYEVPPDYAHRHYLLFTFPWSHGLLPDIGWALIFGGAVWLLRKDRLAATIAGIAVLSHYLLDGLVHVKGLPIAGPGSPEFGLGLWRNLPLESAIEASMALMAMLIYWRVSADRATGRRIGMLIYVALLGALTIGGMVTATEVPPRSTLVASWLIAPVAIAAVAAWIDWAPVRAKAEES